MSYSIATSNQFEKDVKKCKKRNYNIELLKIVVSKLEETGKLEASYNPHKLSGNYAGIWEAHIKPNWLILWQQDDVLKEITLARTGTHSDLF